MPRTAQASGAVAAKDRRELFKEADVKREWTHIQKVVNHPATHPTSAPEQVPNRMASILICTSQPLSVYH